jgi:hypothetical protein
MITKEFCIHKYKEFKKEYGKIPKCREYCKYAGFDNRKLVELFEEDPYSKLQIECGDTPNKLSMDRTPLDKIMRQYGDLALELKKLPKYSNWSFRKLKPTEAGLNKVHGIVWSEFPQRFKGWVEEGKIKGYEKVVELIEQKIYPSWAKKDNPEFQKLIKKIREWSPARGRNSEETYKVELRSALIAMSYKVGEEHGDSNVDIIVNRKYAVELKKSPGQSDYDRLFGQLARHLQQYKDVIALIMDVNRGDKHDEFCSLVDAFLNRGEYFVEVIKK